MWENASWRMMADSGDSLVTVIRTHQWTEQRFGFLTWKMLLDGCSHRAVARPGLSFDTHLRKEGRLSTGATLIRFYGVVMMRREEVRWDERRWADSLSQWGSNKWAFYREMSGAKNISCPQFSFQSNFDPVVPYSEMKNRLTCKSKSIFYFFFQSSLSTGI